MAGLVLAGLLPGCTKLGYLGHAAWGEAQILLSRRPVAEALGDPDLDPERRAKLELVVRTAAAAQSELKLKRDDQYREVAELGPDFQIWVLVLAPPDALTAVTWSFPIAGEVPYLGFFQRERAEAMAAAHYPDHDRHIRTASAFSTLGYLPDPILPGFFALPPPSIVNTVVHELVHATVYVPGQSEWNETVATALGDAGAVRLAEAWGKPQWAEATRARVVDRQRWAGLVAAAARDLRTAYRAATDTSERMAIKARRIAALREQIRTADWRIEAYRSLADREINHAFLVAQETYLKRPEWQTAWYRAALTDYTGAVDALQRMAEQAAEGDGTGLWRSPKEVGVAATVPVPGAPSGRR